MASLNAVVKKRSIMINNKKTSMSLEEPFWAGLKQVASERNTSMQKLVGTLNNERDGGNLSSTVRVFLLDHYRGAVAANDARPEAPPDHEWDGQ
jgi:predicted DNA-binding ribbon-helix-helix protein